MVSTICAFIAHFSPSTLSHLAAHMATWGAHPSRARAKDNDKDKDKCGRGWGAEVGVGGEAGPWGLGHGDLGRRGGRRRGRGGGGGGGGRVCSKMRATSEETTSFSRAFLVAIIATQSARGTRHSCTWYIICKVLRGVRHNNAQQSIAMPCNCVSPSSSALSSLFLFPAVPPPSGHEYHVQTATMCMNIVSVLKI